MVAGVDRIEFNPTYGTKDVCVNEHNVGAFRRAQREIQAAATSLNMPVWFLRDFGLDYGEGDDTMTIGVSDSHIRSMSETHWLSEQVLRKRIAESSYLRLE